MLSAPASKDSSSKNHLLITVLCSGGQSRLLCVSITKWCSLISNYQRKPESSLGTAIKIRILAVDFPEVAYEKSRAPEVFTKRSLILKLIILRQVR